MTALRILHFPTDVGGHPSALSRAERSLDAHSEVAVLRKSWLRYPVDIDLGAKPNLWSDLSTRLRFMLRAAREYDVFHFNFGQSFLPRLRDLRWLRRRGKRVFVTFQGCDARQQSVCARFALSCCGDQQGEGLCSPTDDGTKAKLIARACRDAHGVFALNPDLLHVIPNGEFLPYALDWPRDEEHPPRASGPMRIFHAPTNRRVKGTEHVLAAVEALRSKFEIELHLIENLPHEEAMARYREADLVIDQLRVGWYGGFAVELMGMGKPVVAYIREEDLRFVPGDLARELPIISATPDTLPSVLERLLAQPAQLRVIGQRSRRFAEKWHDPRGIAQRLLRRYEAAGEITPASGERSRSRDA